LIFFKCFLIKIILFIIFSIFNSIILKSFKKNYQILLWFHELSRNEMGPISFQMIRAIIYPMVNFGGTLNYWISITIPEPRWIHVTKAKSFFLFNKLYLEILPTKSLVHKGPINIIKYHDLNLKYRSSWIKNKLGCWNSKIN
jgi:hypothetical protein